MLRWLTRAPRGGDDVRAWGAPAPWGRIAAATALLAAREPAIAFLAPPELDDGDGAADVTCRAAAFGRAPREKASIWEELTVLSGHARLRWHRRLVLARMRRRRTRPP